MEAIEQNKIFKQTKLGSLAIKNRIIRSATAELSADFDGKVTQEILDLYGRLADGNLGLIITGLTEVVEGTDSFTLMKISDDKHIEGLKKLTSQMRAKDNKLIVQLVHIGQQVFGIPDYEPFSPSGVSSKNSKFKSKEMTIDDIKTVVDSFGNAALRAKKAGFDGVQVHAAHGYLISQFLTPFYNRRTDCYGGSIENRSRILFDVIENIISKCGPDFPILIKLNASDFLDKEGFTFEECKIVCKELTKYNISAIEISGGSIIGDTPIVRTKINDHSKEAYHLHYASILSTEISTPIISVGGFRSFDVAQKAIAETNIQAISLSRPLICEPDLVKRWSKCNTEKSRCISCNKCFNPKGTSCVFN